MRFSRISSSLAVLATAVRAGKGPGGKTCVVQSAGTNETDDAPAITKAFEDCGKGGHIIFEPTTYHVNSVLEFTRLRDAKIDIQGTLLWSPDIEYWLENSLEVGFQNHSTALILGGDNLLIEGHGAGTFDGNGDYWYKWISEQENTSNYPGRPHAVTFNGLKNSVVRGVNFVRSQMWTMSIINSHYVDFVDILVNNTGNEYQSSNTDGADTIASSHINFKNWTIYNGDDGIALKGNSTHISITDSKFYDGLGIALGSLAQYYRETEVVEGLKVRDCYFENTLHALYAKTWTDDRNGYPPNGGGGGLGYAKDVTAKNLTSVGMRGSAFSISQCTRFIGAPGDGNCTNSQFQLSDITIDGLHGTTESDRVASLQCSAVAPCKGIGLFDIDLKFENGTVADRYLCGNAKNTRGFECNGEACEGGSSTGEC